MTRPKVDPDKRIRTANACDSCKRRKQKCDGKQPCNTCTKRNIDCTYGAPGAANAPPSPVAAPAGPPPPKRRLTEDNAPFSYTQRPSDQIQERSQPPPVPFSHPVSEASAAEDAARSLQLFSSKGDDKPNGPLPSRGTTASVQDEEAVVYHQSRMLQDPTGRLLYIGDSASLSYLQLIRMIVENVSGPSPFTTDPRRHRIVESQFLLPPNFRPTHLLPDREAAFILAESFFINTHGFIQVFERQSFMSSLEHCYSDPLSVEPQWLCLVNLVFAIGLMLATPKAGTREDAVLGKLLESPIDRAEMFYMNAKSLNDPLTGFEDGGFWSIQALLLMATYMLTKSKRNTAYALFGMAVRSAFALGLHREETLIIFSAEEQAARRNLWRSLFVMDRFLSCSLGRPVAIHEEDCSGDALCPPKPTTDPAFAYPPNLPVDFNQTSNYGLEAAVRTCSVVGTVLRQVYQQRKISTRLAQEIVDTCKEWPNLLAPMLHWRQAKQPANASQGIAILHVNLFYCHSIILLTRPFFLFLMHAEMSRQGGTDGQPPPRNASRMEKFSEACVNSSLQSVELIQSAFEAGYLPRRNPVVIYFLFAAALVVLSNEFATLHHRATAVTSIDKALSLMHYCSQTDDQADRLLYILGTFRAAVMDQRKKKKADVQSSDSNNTPRVYTNSSPALNNLPSRILPQQASTEPPLSPVGLAARTIPSPASYTNVSPNHGINFTSINSILSPSPTSANSNLPPPHLPVPNILPSPHIRPGGYSAPSPSSSVHNLLNGPMPANHPPPHPPPTRPPPSHHPSALNTNNIPPLERHTSLSNLLDLGTYEVGFSGGGSGGGGGNQSDESAGADEQFDFDALWAWPAGGPPAPQGGSGLGTPGGVAVGGEMARGQGHGHGHGHGQVQGQGPGPGQAPGEAPPQVFGGPGAAVGADSAVPLYGMVDK